MPFTKIGDQVTGASRWFGFGCTEFRTRGTSRQRRPGSGRTCIETWDSGVVNVALVSTRVAPETRRVDEVSLETKEKKGSRDGRWQGCPRWRKWSGLKRPKEKAGDSKHQGGPWWPWQEVSGQMGQAERQARDEK